MTHFHILESHKSMRIDNDKLSGVHEATDVTLRHDTKLTLQNSEMGDKMYSAECT
jgi:hypothetical protein